jgi:hypothetical protein
MVTTSPKDAAMKDDVTDVTNVTTPPAPVLGFKLTIYVQRNLDEALAYGFWLERTMAVIAGKIRTGVRLGEGMGDEGTAIKFAVSYPDSGNMAVTAGTDVDAPAWVGENTLWAAEICGDRWRMSAHGGLEYAAGEHWHRSAYTPEGLYLHAMSDGFLRKHFQVVVDRRPKKTVVEHEAERWDGLS